jgi:hypothetical protein
VGLEEEGGKSSSRYVTRKGKAWQVGKKRKGRTCRKKKIRHGSGLEQKGEESCSGNGTVRRTRHGNGL